MDVIRDNVITIPLSDEEIEVAKSEAQKLGMPVSSFIRLLIKNFADGVTFQKK